MNIRGVVLDKDRVILTVPLRRRRLVCPLCEHSARARYDLRDIDSRWRHLDLGAWRLEIRARLRRLSCPTHGVKVEGVPFARHSSNFTTDFKEPGCMAGSQDRQSPRSSVCFGSRGARSERLFEIGIDEISWRKQHNYLTLVSDHRSGKVVWGAEGKDTKTPTRSSPSWGTEHSARLSALSMDMGEAYLKSVRKEDHAPQATVCIDPFHVVALATKALDEVRRAV